MAKMIPDLLPPETESVAERELFSILRDDLDDDYTVIHSLPWIDGTTRRYRKGECDFLVLHPCHGMLAVEAKSGAISFDASTQSWYQNGGTRLRWDPLLQAQRSVHYLDKLLKRDVKGYSAADVPFGHAAVFPHADQIRGRLPLHAEPELIVLKSELPSMQHRIETALGRFRKPRTRMNRELMNRIENRLLPEFHLIQTLQSRFQDQATELARLTEQQIQLLDSMRRCPRLVIEGCAGSGKTVLAMEKATQLARDGKRVLLLCFNIPLAETMQAALKDQASVDVYNYHGMCEHVIRATGGEFTVPIEDQENFWDHTVPDCFLDCVDQYPKRYDAILVDEAQDFSAHWWDTIECLFEDYRTGSFYLFHDPDQNIFQRENRLPFEQPVMVLDVNCRNTDEIATFVHALSNAPSRSADFVTEGIKPVEHVVSSDEEEVVRTIDMIKELTTRESISSDRIVIIGRHRFERSPYSRASDSLTGGLRIVEEARYKPASDAVRYATIYRFKGLETDCAILSGFDRPEPQQKSRELYVAASRARMLLHLIYRDDKVDADQFQKPR